jgi:hypothetical protein
LSRRYGHINHHSGIPGLRIIPETATAVKDSSFESLFGELKDSIEGLDLPEKFPDGQTRSSALSGSTKAYPI